MKKRSAIIIPWAEALVNYVEINLFLVRLY